MKKVTAVKMLGLVILAALASAIFVFCYGYASALSSIKAAREAALDVDARVRGVIATGSPTQIDNVRIPRGYTLRFSANRILIDGISLPEAGYPLPIVGPELGEGNHVLIIELGDNSVVVRIG